MGNKLVLDTSIVIDGKISELLETDTLAATKIIVPRAVLDELQAQASKNREAGFIGLKELKRLREICVEKKIELTFSGSRPSLDDIRLAKSGRVDALIRDVAKAEDAILVTADYVQALVAEAEGVKTEFHRGEAKTTGLIFEEFFSPDTLSIHLKENLPPMAKKGRPGSLVLTKLRDEAISSADLEQLIKEISEAARIGHHGYVEISRSGATVIQLGLYRIAITRPPFSDGLEVTIVRPIVRLTLEDYHLSSKLMNRLRDRAEGILIAGPPGSGKSTLASSLADFYTAQGKIVKTFESPRDLQVAPEITQYGPLEGDFEKTAEILLLVRPDYTIFDEVRRTDDFGIFSDMRLAGVGMVGVVHASDPVGAVQRFMGRVELGMIPHIIDTVIFVKAGEISKVYDLNLVVKVPSGMTEADLARPVVEVRDFENSRLEYEIYTFGEENVIIPVEDQDAVNKIRRLAEERIYQLLKKYDPDVEVEIISDNRAIVRVEKACIPRLIGKRGNVISKIEKTLGIGITVEAKIPTLGEDVSFKIKETGNSIDLQFSDDIIGETVNIFVDGDYLFSATVGRKGRIRVSRSSEIGKTLVNSLLTGKEVKVTI